MSDQAEPFVIKIMNDVVSLMDECAKRNATSMYYERSDSYGGHTVVWIGWEPNE